MKYPELVEIYKALSELLPERLPVAYEIAKNIKEIEKHILSTQDTIKTLQETYALKGPDGKVVTEQTPDGLIVKFETLEIKDQYQKEILKVQQEELNPDLKRIKASQLKDIKLPARILLPLLDVIIEGD